MNKRLLYSAVLAAALSSSAQAQTVSAPVFNAQPTQLKLDGTDTVYIYNVKAQKWLTKGNYYGTEATLDSIGSGLKFAIVPNTGSSAGTYTLNNETSSGTWKKLFIAGVTSENAQANTYVDYNNQGAWRTKWVLHTNGTSFQIQADTIAADLTGSDESKTALVAIGESRFGYLPNVVAKNNNGNETGKGAVSGTIPRDSISKFEAGVEWQAYTVEDVDAYVYRRDQLMKIINDGAAAGADVSAAVAVYNNSDATLAELKAAAGAIEEAVRNATMKGASYDNPVDITSYVTNADCSSLTGWTTEGTFDSNGNAGSGGNGTKWQSVTPGTASDNTTHAKGLERWISADSDKATNSTVTNAGKLSDSKLSQTLENLPAGAYEISAYCMATHQGLGNSHHNTGTYLFGTGMEVNVSTNSGTPEPKKVIAVVGEDGKLTFGYETRNTTCNWVYITDLTVKYLGEGQDNLDKALKALAEETIDGIDPNLDANETYTDALSTALEAVSGLLSKSGLTQAEMQEALAKVEDTKIAAEANEAAYEELKSYVETVQTQLQDMPSDTYPKVDDLSDLLDIGTDEYSRYSDIIDGYMLTTEQIAEYRSLVAQLLDAALKSGIQPGKEVPSLILADPNFDNGGEGWLGKETVSAEWKNCEAYQKTFDMYQILEDIPNGVYTVSLQAMQRVGTNDVASAAHDAGTENITAYVYGNEIKKKVASPYSEGRITEDTEITYDGWKDYAYELNGQTVYIANCMQGFNSSTEQGLYKNTISVLVQDGTLRLGIKCDENGTGYWTIWDNFSAVYNGTDEAAYRLVLDQILENATPLTSQKMSPEAKATLEKAIAEVTATPNETTILALNAAVETAEASVADYKGLKDAIDDVEKRHDALVDNTRSSEAEAGYTAAVATAKGVYENCTAADSAAVASTIYDLKKAYTTYLISDDAKKATAENPVDISYVMSNYDFATMDQTGWTGTTGGFDSGNNVAAMEYYEKDFDFYQEIPGLPAGRYELAVRGFFRYSSTATMADSINAGKPAVKAIAYLNDQEEYVKSLAAGAASGKTLTELGVSTDGMTTMTDVNGDEVYVANNMISAQNVFNDETIGSKYDAIISYYTAEDADFKVGAKMTGKASYDWAIFGSFTLKYFGNGSDGIESITSKSNAAGVLGTQVYNVNGVATGKLQKGLNIVKTTLSDGTVKVSKVIVK